MPRRIIGYEDCQTPPTYTIAGLDGVVTTTLQATQLEFDPEVEHIWYVQPGELGPSLYWGVLAEDPTSPITTQSFFLGERLYGEPHFLGDDVIFGKFTEENRWDLVRSVGSSTTVLTRIHFEGAIYRDRATYFGDSRRIYVLPHE